MSDDIEYSKELLAIKRRRLQDLSKKAAFYGIDCPSHITLEITDIRSELEQIQATIRASEQAPFEEKFKNDLIEKSDSQLLELVIGQVYNSSFIEDFILDQDNHVSLRVAALGLYLESGLRNDAFFKQLLRDINQEFRRSVLQNARKYDIDIDQATLENIIQDRLTSQDVLSYTVKIIYELVKKRHVSPAILADTHICNHPYWLIRADAISAIIEADSIESVNLLSKFVTSTYWKSRKKIYQYFARLYEQNRLAGSDLETAKHILLNFIEDGKSSDKAVVEMTEVLTSLYNSK